MTEHIDIVFDGPPSHESGRFVEVEDEIGASVKVGTWIEEGDYWRLRIPYMTPDERARLLRANGSLLAALRDAVTACDMHNITFLGMDRWRDAIAEAESA